MNELHIYSFGEGSNLNRLYVRTLRAKCRHLQTLSKIIGERIDDHLAPTATATPEITNQNVIITVNRNAPRHVDQVVAGETHRCELDAIWTDQVHHTGGFGIAQHGSAKNPKLFH